MSGSFDEVIQILLDTAPAGCTLLNEKLEIAAINDATLSILGIASNTGLIGAAFASLLPRHQLQGEISADFLKRHLGRVGAIKTARFFMDVILTGKSFIQLEVSCNAIFLGGRKFYVAHIRELVGNCLECPSLDDNRNLVQRMSDMLDHMPIMCNTFDKDFNIIDCNQKSVEIFGMQSKQEFIERFPEVSPKLQPCGTPSMEKAVSCIAKAFIDGIYTFDWMDQIPDTGEPVPSIVTLIRFQWKDEYYVVAFIHDMREFHKLSELERISRERIQYMLDSMPIASLLVGKDLTTAECNSEALRLFGVADKNKCFNPFLERSPEYQPDGRLSTEKIKGMFMEAHKSGHLVFEWMHQTAEKNALPCEVTLVRLYSGDEDMVIAYIRDLRNAKHAAQMLARLEQLEKLAYTDPLTGAYNRRYFMAQAEKKLEKNISEHKQFSIIMADLDHFKAINDKYGHSVGDSVLQVFVARLKNALKHDAVVARYGGEEFIILLDMVNEKTAGEIATRLNRTLVESTFRVEGKSITVTASFGVASLCEGAKTLDSIINNADMSLYAAKHAGRNKVVCFTDLGCLYPKPLH